MGQMVIVVYRARDGQEARALDLIREHVPALRAEGLATERQPVVMRAADGAFVEVFEWVSAEAIEKAHSNAAVQAMWARFGEACEFGTLSSLDESTRMFPSFVPVDV